jgi:hypothetical protein
MFHLEENALKREEIVREAIYQNHILKAHIKAMETALGVKLEGSDHSCNHIPVKN